MEFENRSGLQAALTRGGLPGEGKTLAVVIAKACAELREAGRFELVPEVPVPVTYEPVKHEFGTIPADVVIRKRGMDVIALGKAYHPRIDGGQESRVSVRVGGDRRELCIFGERQWYKSNTGSWAVTDPQPFSLMSLTWENSYGGTSFDEWGNDMLHPLNREGKGFIADEQAIEGTHLPNIEDAEHRVTHWQDQPRPCNIAPAPKHIAFDPAPYAAQLEAARKEPFRLPEAIWNDAVPKFQFEKAPPGTTIQLAGMSETPLLFDLPALRLSAKVQTGPRRGDFELALDTVMFMPEQRRCVLTWRAHFMYEFIPRQERRVVLERQA
ncbi:MAG TPA: DUF2169 domain-containing protein [Polyangiaceae bacterium]|nr:DUF2169 domain-containing protein [Polyangiaceae bacterium]